MFADMCAAYDALSPAMKARLATLTGRHGYPAGGFAKLYGEEYVRNLNKDRRSSASGGGASTRSTGAMCCSSIRRIAMALSGWRTTRRSH